MSEIYVPSKTLSTFASAITFNIHTCHSIEMFTQNALIKTIFLSTLNAVFICVSVHAVNILGFSWGEWHNKQGGAVNDPDWKNGWHGTRCKYLVITHNKALTNRYYDELMIYEQFYK